MAGLAALMPRGEELAALWRAYEAQADEESRFVRQLDRLDMGLQALRYEQTTSLDFNEFLDSAREVLRDPELVALLTR
jgi:putative hydrolase of HD superfamily